MGPQRAVKCFHCWKNKFDMFYVTPCSQQQVRKNAVTVHVVTILAFWISRFATDNVGGICSMPVKLTQARTSEVAATPLAPLLFLYGWLGRATRSISGCSVTTP